MTNTANLGMPFIEGSQAQKHVTHNEALRILDAAVQIGVLDTTLTAPPVSPSEGDRHVVAAGATGAWTGQAKAIATWEDGAWRFLPPKAGWFLWSAGDNGLFVYDGTAWRNLHDLTTALDNATHIGVNTTATSPNLLAVRSNAALFNAIATADGGSGDARVQISKESSANTASVVFSDAFSGRAEFGLVGSDAFKLKVSNDGSTFVEALNIDQTSGNAALPRGLLLTGVISPSQITSNQNDYSPAGLGAASVLNLSADTSRNISGLAGGAEGRVLAVVNVGSQPLVLLDESTSSTAANRFSLRGDLPVASKQAVLLRYDGGSSRWYALARPPGRDSLNANRTYYVRTDGSDNNDGLSDTSGGAFLTLQKAWNAALTIDLKGFDVTIRVGSGTFTAGISATSAPMGGLVSIVGAGSSLTTISVTGGKCLRVACPTTVTISGVKLTTPTSGICLSTVGAGSKITVGSDIEFGAAGDAHMSADQNSIIAGTSSYKISGSSAYHYNATAGSIVQITNCTVTLTGTPAFSGSFVFFDTLSIIVIYNVTYSGSATGQRYNGALSSVLKTYGAATASTYFPGNANGTVSTNALQT